MANLRELKKDIDFLTSEIVSQSFFKEALKDNVDKEALSKVVVDAVSMRNEFIARANHPDGKDNKKIVRNYYKVLRKSLYDTSFALLETLDKL